MNGYQVNIYFYRVFFFLLFGAFSGMGGAFMAQDSAPLQTEYLSINDGLSGRQVNDILISRYGTVWFGTENGLNKFDGYDFSVFNQSQSPQSQHHISADNVEALKEDKDGHIVILYENIVSFFDILDPLSGSSQRVNLLPQNGVRGIPRKINIDNDGNVFILATTDHEIQIYQFEKNSTSESSVKLLFQLPLETKNRRASIDLLHMINGFFFLNNSLTGLDIYDSSGQLIKHFEKKDFKGRSQPFLYPRHPYFLYQDKFSNVWLSLSNVPGIFKFDPVEQVFVHVKSLPRRQFFTKIWEDNAGNLMLAQTAAAGDNPPIEKLFCLTPDGNVNDFSHLTKVSNNILSCKAKDYFKTLFFGIDTGVKIIRNNRTKINTYLSKNLDLDRRGALIRGVTDRGDNFIHFSKERDLWFRLDNNFHTLDTLDLRDEKVGKPLKFSNASNLIFDTNGDLWGAATSKEGMGILIQYNLDTCSTRIFSYPFPITSFAYDTSTNIFWLGVKKGEKEGELAVFNPKKETFSPFLNVAGENPLTESPPLFVCLGHGNDVLVGTENGLFVVNKESADFRKYGTEGGGEDGGLSNEVIYSIYVGKDDGRLWLGTKNGLNILDPHTGKVEVLTKEDGLASNTVYGILPGENGNFWISTFNGLSYFEPQTHSFHNFYRADGFSHNEFNRFSYHKDLFGNYYFGGVNGLNVFSPAGLLIEKNIPKVMLTRFVRFDSKVDSLQIIDTGLNELTDITIKPSDTYFSFDFALPVYHQSRKNQFKYYLENYDKTWVNLSTNHSIRYNRLPARDYVLHIIGADPNGNWSDNSLDINIHVAQVFYKKWGFIALMILLIAGLLFLLFRYQLEQRLKVERLRTRLASDLHDELSGLLTGIAMQTDLLSALTEKPLVQSKLKKIGLDSRSAMSKMSDVIWSIDSRKDRVEDLVIRIQEHADEILLPLNIQYKIGHSNIDVKQKMPGKIRQEIYFIAKEVINNIAKHSKASFAEIMFVKQDGLFKLIIKDNGTGNASIPNLKGGQGLKNIEMRAKRIGANYSIYNKKGYVVLFTMKNFLK